MCFKSGSKTKRGWTLIEMMVAVGVFSIAGLALMTVFLFSIRSYAAMANYSLLNQQSRQAMDQFSSEIRQAITVTDYITNSTSRALTILNAESNLVTFTFDAVKSQVRRSCNGTDAVLLDNCSLLDFNLYTRPPPAATNDFLGYEATNGLDTVKVIQLAWRTSMTINPTTVRNSENVQTAKIVIRKKQDSL